MNATGIGAQLRGARVAKNLSLEEVSRQTKIASHFLESIEQGQFEQLPGVLFTRNFVRQYAAAVALDPNPLLAGLPQMDDTLRQLPAAPLHPRKRRRGWNGHGNSLASSVVWFLLALGSGLAAWSHYGHHSWNWRRLLSSAPPSQPQATPAPPASQPVPAHEPEAQPVQPQAEVPPVEAQAPVAQAAPELPLSQHPVEVVVTAAEAAWVQLIADGKTAFAGTLQPNETRQISAVEKVKIVAGNAGRLAVSLNGKKLDSLGPEGQVRVITLTAAGPQLPPSSPQPPLQTSPASDRL